MIWQLCNLSQTTWIYTLYLSHFPEDNVADSSFHTLYINDVASVETIYLQVQNIHYMQLMGFYNVL